MTKYVECRIIDIDEPPRQDCTSVKPRRAVVAITRRPKPHGIRILSIGTYQTTPDHTYWQGQFLNCLA